MKRVFYYSGYRMTVFHWTGGKFAGSYYFEPTDEGRNEFLHYLQKTPRVPGRILVDVIEEDFRIETVPHVMGSDRKALVKRLLERYFRNSGSFTWYQFNEREKTGRKDDRVLLAALTNPDMLRPWMNMLAQEEVPIFGIWSLPLLSQKVLGRLDAKSGHVLLISQQVSSNVRQSYFKNGKLVSSRLATITLEGGLSYGRFLLEEIEQTTRFLTNKRYLGFDESLQVHIIPPEEHLESVRRECVNTATRQVMVHRVQDVERKVASQGTIGPYGNGIFAQLCNDAHLTHGHYGGVADFSVFYRYLTGKAMQWSAAAMVLLSVLAAANMYFKMEHMQQAAQDIRSEAALINGRYQQELQPFESALQQAPVMKASVDLAERIQRNKQVSPQNFMVSFSNMLSQRRFNLLEISGIEWNMQSGAGESLLSPVLLADMPVHQAIITGRAPVNAGNLRDVTEQINLLAETLRQDQRVISVRINKLPVDVRPSANVSMQLGQQGEQSDSAEFSLSLMMKGGDA